VNHILVRLTKPELERRIALLGRAAERFPELREAILLERARLERVLVEKRAARKPARPVEVTT
jgi:hypothetical protein